MTTYHLCGLMGGRGMWSTLLLRRRTLAYPMPLLGSIHSTPKPGGDRRFDSFRAAGVLDRVIAAAWDEPNLHATLGDVQRTVAMIRQVAAGYQELAGLKFWAVWADGSTKGMAPYFDALGHDSYGSGVVVVDLLPGQGLLLFPGGADPWREPPDGFTIYAEEHAEVVAVIPFIWRTPRHSRRRTRHRGQRDMQPHTGQQGVVITHRC